MQPRLLPLKAGSSPCPVPGSRAAVSLCWHPAKPRLPSGTVIPHPGWAGGAAGGCRGHSVRVQGRARGAACHGPGLQGVIGSWPSRLSCAAFGVVCLDLAAGGKTRGEPLHIALLAPVEGLYPQGLVSGLPIRRSLCLDVSVWSSPRASSPEQGVVTVVIVVCAYQTMV